MQPSPARGADGPPRELMVGYLLHLGCNMWGDHYNPEWKHEYVQPSDTLRLDKDVWDEVTERFPDAHINTAVIDLGEGVKYDSHPEISVKGSWTTTKLRRELTRLRGLGLEPIPKLNFGAGHDHWLGEYSRMVSTDVYYRVCADLIAEVCELFDRPRFFHIGMDEETAMHQRFQHFICIRQYDLWWNDLYRLIDHVEQGGARAWVWSDHIWRHTVDFVYRMPRTVLQSNWYYRPRLSLKEPRCEAYIQLDNLGFEQVPTASNHSNPENFGRTVTWCRRRISPRRLVGFLQTPWRPAVEAYRDRHFEAVQCVKDAIGPCA